jgi:hypothetical protein
MRRIMHLATIVAIFSSLASPASGTKARDRRSSDDDISANAPIAAPAFRNPFVSGSEALLKFTECRKGN